MPYSDVNVTGLNKFQNIYSDVFATMNNDIPEPKPYPDFSTSSSNMTMNPAPISWIIIKAILVNPRTEGGPYAPYQTCPTASPKQSINAKVFSNLVRIFSSFGEVILNNPIAANIWMIQEAEMMGEIPNSIKVPLLEARMTLVQ